jgi:hypothetical protein
MSICGIRLSTIDLRMSKHPITTLLLLLRVCLCLERTEEWCHGGMGLIRRGWFSSFKTGNHFEEAIDVKAFK